MKETILLSIGICFGIGIGVLFTDCGRAGWQEDQNTYVAPLNQFHQEYMYDRDEGYRQGQRDAQRNQYRQPC